MGEINDRLERLENKLYDKLEQLMDEGDFETAGQVVELMEKVGIV